MCSDQRPIYTPKQVFTLKLRCKTWVIDCCAMDKKCLNTEFFLFLNFPFLSENRKVWIRESLCSKSFHEMVVVVLKFILKKYSLYFLNDGINSLKIAVLI